MDKKLGVYVCSGCGIGQCVDTEKIAQIARDGAQGAVVKTSPAFCLEDVRLISVTRRNALAYCGRDSF